METRAGDEVAGPYVLGMHIGHNSSVAGFVGGKPTWAVQEERLTRRKNQGGLPRRGLAWLRDRSDLIPEVTVLGWANLVRRRWTREAVLAQYGDSGHRVRAAKRWLRMLPGVSSSIDRRRLEALEAEAAGVWGDEIGTVRLTDHHRSHASAAYFGRGRSGSGTLVLTCDGAGDGACATVSIGRGSALEELARVGDTHSIGRLYGLVTFLLGMVPLEHEYKLMGLAPYGEEDRHALSLADAFSSLFRFKGEDGLRWETTIRGGMRAALPRLESIVQRQRFDHVAAGLQVFTERFLCRWVKNCVRATGLRDVVLGGGVFMNVKANQRILNLPDVESLYVFPSCGDETNCFGAPYAHLETKADVRTHPVEHLYLGDSVSGEDVEAALSTGTLNSLSVKITEASDETIDEAIAELLATNGIVARARGRMEFGARALGNRSILADPAKPDVVRTINAMIKQRDFWMPFAPAVLREDFDRYFVRVKDVGMPFMVMGCNTQERTRSEIRGAIHPHDFTARPQEVNRDTNPGFARVLEGFRALTGRAAVLNTSFNLHGEPIVASASDAMRVFACSDLPAMAVGPFLLEKV